MLTVTWNHSGFHVVTTLRKELKFNTGYDTYTTQILERIRNWWKVQRAGSTRKLVVHWNNARFHTVKLTMDFMDANRMTQAPHPAHSPDLAPSDFFLFGNMKRQLSGCSFGHADDLQTAVQEILERFDKPTLIKSFEKWVRTLEQRIETTGESIG
jgi:hypothetical protein